MSNPWTNPADQQPQGSAPFGGVPAPQQMPAPPAYAAPPVYPGMPAPAYPGAQPGVSTTRGMYTAAVVLNWVGFAIVAVATFGIGLIAAAWVVPMTILTQRASKGPYKHTALAVCTLLFVNIISGILMLVDDSNRPPKPVAYRS